MSIPIPPPFEPLLAEEDQANEIWYRYWEQLANAASSSGTADPLILSNRTTDVSAPSSGNVAYYAKDNQLWSRLSTGQPAMLRRRYSGNLSISTADAWQEIIENHEGRGATITLAGGNYTSTGLNFMGLGPLKIVASTVGATTITVTGRFLADESWCEIEGINFVQGGDLFARFNGCFMDFQDCSFDFTADLGATNIWGVAGGVTRFDADTRDTNFAIPQTASQVFDFDTGADSKWVSDEINDNHFIFDVDDNIGTDVIIIGLDNSNMVASGLRIVSGNMNGVGVDLGRNSHLQLNDECAFDGLNKGIVCNQFSQVTIAGLTTIRLCDTGLEANTGGTIKYVTANVSFSGNNANTDDNTAAGMTKVGGGP